MTPLLFTSFLLSLLLVDLRHSALRSHYHADATQPSRMPGWLHRIVYRYRRYRYVAVDDRAQAGTPTPSPGSPGSPGMGGVAEAEDYYHSKQRKLMKMEAEEAFEMRGVVVVVLGLVSFGVLWAVWRAVEWGLGAVRVLVS
jgi:hypothetical protein